MAILKTILGLTKLIDCLTFLSQKSLSFSGLDQNTFKVWARENNSKKDYRQIKGQGLEL
jgi:hypothetical protein